MAARLPKFFARSILVSGSVDTTHTPKMASPVVDIDSYGTRRWYKDGKRHRDGDLPAVVFENGDAVWYKDGKRHRDGDKPAVVFVSGYCAWFINNKRHRDCDLPAIVYDECKQSWYRHGKLHRDIGPADCMLRIPMFFTHGIERKLLSIKGETMVGYSPASWSLALCFI